MVACGPCGVVLNGVVTYNGQWTTCHLLHLMKVNTSWAKDMCGGQVPPTKLGDDYLEQIWSMSTHSIP